MQIIFLNTLNGQYAKKIQGFIDRHKSDTDVFCFQEAFFSGANFRAISDKLLSNYKSIDVFKYTDDKEIYYGQATYVKNTIHLIKSLSLFKAETQLGSALSIMVEINGNQLHITNFHGTPAPGDKKDTPERLAQSYGILQYAKQMGGKHIIGGDFNLDINTQSVRQFEEDGYVNAIRKYNIRTTRNHIAWDKYPEDPQMYADFVFVSPSIKIQNFTVPSDIVSDHQAMVLQVEI